jgi:hypothetical protein
LEPKREAERQAWTMNDEQMKLLTKTIVAGLRPLIEQHRDQLMLSGIGEQPSKEFVTHRDLQNFIMCRNFSLPNGHGE